MGNDDAREFDRFADNYRDIHTNNINKVSGTDSEYFIEYKIKELKCNGRIPKKGKWLDLGCGDGLSAPYVKRYFPGFSYMGIDVSPKSIEVANKNWGEDKDTEFKVYDGKTIPLEDESVDLIYISCVMHHIPPKNRMHILKECKRVLKRKGRIVVFEHNPLNPVTRRMVNTCPFDRDAVLLTSGSLKKMFEKINMKGENRFTIFFPRKGIFERFLSLEEKMYWIPMGGQYYGVYRKKN